MIEWRDVVGYEERFLISSTGLLYSKLSKKLLSQTISESGYYCHCTRIGGRKGKCIILRIHRLVCEAFHPNHEGKPIVNHKDGNKLNNSKDNLEWSTYSENAIHAVSAGLVNTRKGEDTPSSKLTCDLVLKIREEYKNTKTTYAKLGIKYNVCHSTIGSIIRGKSWKHC